MFFASPQCLIGVNYLAFARKSGLKGNPACISTDIGLISEIPSAVGFHTVLKNSGIFCALLAHRKDRFLIAHIEEEAIELLESLSVR